MEIQHLPIETLTNHELNDYLYGPAEVEDLVDSIRKYGLQEPIIVTEDRKIISGHRRVKAHKLLGLETIPSYVRPFSLPGEDARALILANQYRTKTNEMRIREGMELEKAERELSLYRQKLGKGDSGFETGATRDIIGKRVGLSGKSWEDGKKVVEEIDRLREEDPEGAQELSSLLNTSITRAREKIRNTENRPLGPYNYQSQIEKAVRALESVYDALAPTRNGQTPHAFGHFIGNLQDMAERIKTWYPALMKPCPVCGGTGSVQGTTCRNCIKGKIGEYKHSEH